MTPWCAWQDYIDSALQHQFKLGSALVVTAPTGTPTVRFYPTYTALNKNSLPDHERPKLLRGRDTTKMMTEIITEISDAFTWVSQGGTRKYVQDYFNNMRNRHV